MTNRERFENTLHFRHPGDRLPIFNFAGANWWDQTIDRWRTEGLDPSLTYAELEDFFGLDHDLGGGGGRVMWWWSTWHAVHGSPIIRNEADYERLLPHMFNEPSIAKGIERLKELKTGYDRGDYPMHFGAGGYFAFSRDLFGIMPHMYAFYDCPDLIHRMNRDLVEFQKKGLREAYKVMVPTYFMGGEDMTYNSGPMVSKAMWDEFCAPYYREIYEEFVKPYGTPFIFESDGNGAEIIPWLKEVGITGMSPLERQAGNDIVELRRKFPGLHIIGGFDKMVLNQGEEAIRAEFERILPVMRAGGFLPSVDHQVPPSVSFSDFNIYVKLYREYAERAAKEWTGRG